MDEKYKIKGDLAPPPNVLFGSDLHHPPCQDNLQISI